MFYSQQKEDEILYNKYLNYKNGFFIEIGAMNGIDYSNTKFFEDNLVWNGILIEPTSQFIELEKNRPKCLNFNLAISEKIGEIEFIGKGALSGCKESMSDSYKKLWGIDEKLSYKVKSVPFHVLTSKIDIKKVDLFSIDVEGGEIEVLNTFDWRIPVYIILIELDTHNPDKDEKCREILRKRGFEFKLRIGSNDVWINRENI